MVTHVNLSEKTVEARAYQLEALNEILTNSMMLVLPTAAGKTAVAWMATAEKLTKEDAWVLMVAPTVALVNQHLQGMIKMIESKDQPPISITGQNPQKTRLKLWQSSRIIIATPQVARNDIKNGILDISNCSMMIVDEAHHSTGNHAMAELGEMYNSNSDYYFLI